MLKGDILAGIILAAFGVFVFQRAVQLDYANEYGPGPGFIPFWIGIALVLLALFLIYTTARGGQTADFEGTPWGETAKAMSAWAGLIVSVALLKPLGFLVSFALLSVYLVYLIDRRSWATAATVGIGSAVGFYLVFQIALGLSLPRGPWGF